jgi:hypothetical protein
MPAINPERLKKQVDSLLAVVSDPVELQKSCVELLDFYADRTRKSEAIGEVNGTYHTFDVPNPLMRALSHGLRSRLKEQSAYALPAAAALWEAGYRETRILASIILGEQYGEQVPSWAETWAIQCDDRIVLKELADQGLVSWRKIDPTAFLEKVEIWLNSTRKKLRSFSLLALQSAVEAPSFEDLPTVFRLLDGTTGRFRGAHFHALIQLINALAKRSPPEAAHFLLDELASGDPGTKRVVQNVLGNFPVRQRQLLERALSVKNRTGIIQKTLND